MCNELLIREFKLPLPLFDQHSAWNQCVVDAAVKSDSEAIVSTTHEIFEDTGIASGIWVNHDKWTFPIFSAEICDRPSLEDIQVQSYDGEVWPPVMLPWYTLEDNRVLTRGIPVPETKIRPSDPQCRSSDGSLILYNPQTQEEYDFWQATTAIDSNGVTLGGGRIGLRILMAGSVAYFKVDGPGSQLPVADARAVSTLPRGSCRASGVPYLAGLFVPEDLKGGADAEIKHALVFTLPRSRHIPNSSMDDPPDYVYPATKTETHDFTTNPSALASGERIRLKQEIVDNSGATIDESHYNVKLAPITRIFLRSLREFGAYLVDGGEGFGFSAEDYHTAPLDLSESQIKELIGAEADSELPGDRTKWQVVIDKLNEQLSWELGGDGNHAISFSTKTDDGTVLSNFDAIEDAALPDVNWLRRQTEE